MGTSKISSLCSWMRERSRSSGPSNCGRATANGACGGACVVCGVTRAPLLDNPPQTDHPHRLLRHAARFLRSEPDQLVHTSGMPIELGPRGTMLLQRWQERLEDHLLAVDAADPRAAAADLHLLDASRWAVGAMQVVDGTHLRMAGIVAPLAGGIGDRDHDPLARALRIFAQPYRVVVALRHLPAIEAEDRRRVGQIGMRLDQDRPSL